MITKNEISTLNLSPTKKDFVQIWTELLDVAGKLSERWDPTSTNESDPGIVILKALTGIADRLNYNIDKNILEAFMPTAAQEDSMRKLCDMMGYNIKYLRSAKTDVVFRYSNPEPSEDEEAIIRTGLYIPKFTTVSTADNDISYFTINSVDELIAKDRPEVSIPCLEGQIVKCESINNNNVITLNQLTDDNKYYLPETHIAENGMFIYNVSALANSLVDGQEWTRVDNLNTQARMSRVFKFGFDSYEDRPYVEFPADVGELINDGLFIYYTRTNGINGNISPRMLTQFQIPNSANWDKVSQESFTVENLTAATTGSNIETIEQAYSNYKKTIGTFETLVTCRDYMNKIYTMVDESTSRPLVSNILVTDIRNDINRAITLCSCDDAGICYKENPLVTVETRDMYKPTFSKNTWYVGPETGGIKLTANNFENPSDFDHIGSESAFVEAVEGKWAIVKDGVQYITKLSTLETQEKAIDHFDLVFYPFKTYNQIKSNVKNIESLYENSFKFNENALINITPRLDSTKTIAHKFTLPRPGDVISINNYLRLNTFIATTTKVTTDEGNFIIDKIKMALANAFNMHELDFGEEIPFDKILEVIENADPRIKVASLNEPTLYTTFSVLKEYRRKAANKLPQIVEYAVASPWIVEEEAKQLSKFYEEVTLNKVNADFYIKSTNIDNGFNICTMLDGKEQYLCAVRDSYRDADVQLHFEPFISNDDANKSFIWKYNNTWKDSDENSKVCCYTRLGEDDYFLGAYRNSTTKEIVKDIAISNVSWLKTNAENEFPIKFLPRADLKPYVGDYDYSDKLSTELKLDETYKLFVYISPNNDKLAIRTYYATPIIINKEKYILTTEEPIKAENFYEDKFVFNTTEAKQIYNKLALRNIIAGRVPLFNYEKTFATDFSEGPYLCTEIIDAKPNSLAEPTADDPFTTWITFEEATGNLPVIYTGQYITNGLICYTKSYNPYQGNITFGSSEEPINTISAFCDIEADVDGKLQNVELSSGEVIKFRAPNFITTTTYPAYVNYHLKLNDSVITEARAAIGRSVKDILNDGYEFIFNSTTQKTNWEKAFEYFNTDERKKYIKQFTMTLPVSAFKPMTDDLNSNQEADLTIDDSIIVIPEASATNNLSIDSLMRKSGCFKIKNDAAYYDNGNFKGYKINVAWNPTAGQTAPSGEPNFNKAIKIAGTDSPFITETSSVAAIKEMIIAELQELRKINDTTNVNCLPTAADWTASVTFEYIPFDVNSLETWTEFIKTYCKNGLFSSMGPNELVKEEPIPMVDTAAGESIFYRIYSGHVYEKGKYIDESGHKFINFKKDAFGLLPISDSVLGNLYILEDVGCDAAVKAIAENTEYQLGKNEFLFINYTPSTTSEETTTTRVEPINKVYSEGTIIRPVGFEVGLIDSSTLAEKGTSWVKQAKFDTDEGTKIVNLHSLGANEQIEIRDFAEVVLSYDTLKDNKTIYVYKNFDCPELEGTLANYDPNAGFNKLVKQYTLKEGEYIFYTDASKSETAYFTNGTLVTLSGVIIPRSEVVDIETILDSGLQEIPWSAISLDRDRRKELRFTEYQYVTLGCGDTLGELTLSDSNSEKKLDKNWKPCANDAYYYASTDLEHETKIYLPNIYVTNPATGVKTTGNNGWEVCSLLELNVSPEIFQTLRDSSQVSTGIDCFNSSSGGILYGQKTISPKTIKDNNEANKDNNEAKYLDNNAVSFKTNLICQAVGNIADKNTSKASIASTSGLKSFIVKTFAETEPLIVQTAYNKLTPYVDTETSSSTPSTFTDSEESKVITDIKDSIEIKDGTVTITNTKLTELLNYTRNLKNLLSNCILDFGSYNRDYIIALITALIDNSDDGLQFKLSKVSEALSNSDTLNAKEKMALNDNLTKLSYNNVKDANSLVSKLIRLSLYDITSWDGNTITEKDSGDVWTRVNLNSIKTSGSTDLPDNALKLSVLIEPDTYGIASFYVNYTSDTHEMATWIEIPKSYIIGEDLSLLNTSNESFSGDEVDKLYLKPGLNCVKLNKSGNIFIKTTQESQGELFFDNLRLVKTEQVGEDTSLGLNIKQIDYKYIDTEGEDANFSLIDLERQLLSDIRKIDVNREFYYNVPVEKNIAIEFSETRTDYDTLMNPNIYYDLNNVNNPFVISKLDIDYLDTGIQIAKSSRLD